VVLSQCSSHLTRWSGSAFPTDGYSGGSVPDLHRIPFSFFYKNLKKYTLKHKELINVFEEAEDTVK